MNTPPNLDKCPLCGAMLNVAVGTKDPEHIRIRYTCGHVLTVGHPDPLDELAAEKAAEKVKAP